MDHHLCEIVSNFQPPSPDVRLVLFADGAVHANRLEVHKYLQMCSEYAAQKKVYLCSGLLSHNENLCLCLFGPDGSALLRQPAIQLSMRLHAQFRPGDTVQVAHTEIGNIGLCVDADIFYPQVTRALALKGADLVLSVQNLDPGEDTPERLLCSAWNAAQSNNVYVVNLAGNGYAVTCPVPLTRNQSGYLIPRTGVVPVRFGINLVQLDKIRANLPLLEQINGPLMERYAEQLRRW